MNLYDFFDPKMQELKDSDALRILKKQDENHSYIDFSTNDYLALSNNQNLQNCFYKKYALPLSASSSRLLAGNHFYYDKVEELLGEQYGRPALFFNSGYHLNIGVFSALSSKEDLILSDKLVHASLIEGIRLSRAKHIRYKHLDYHHLEMLLQKYAAQYRHVFIVSESLFSMDGDKADIECLVRLKEQYNAYLYLDEAHAVGALGSLGLGLSETTGFLSRVDLLVGTMGKALSSVGAFLICNETIKQYLVNTCKSFIYTTALPPINMAWSYNVLKQIPDLIDVRRQLQNKVQYLSKILTKNNIPFVGESHILAVITYSNQVCLNLFSYLKSNGLLVQAVRPPTVPKGTSRIRISLNANIKIEDLERLGDLITLFWKDKEA